MASSLVLTDLYESWVTANSLLIRRDPIIFFNKRKCELNVYHCCLWW